MSKTLPGNELDIHSRTDENLDWEYPEELLVEDEEESFGYEEIQDLPECCLLWFFGRQQPYAASEVARLANGTVLAKQFRRTMWFRLAVGRQADLPKIKVIQYVKNDQYRTQAGVMPTPDPRPNGRDWSWATGADGWRVDSDDPIRCWPDYHAQNASRGVRRRRIWVSWFDRPGVHRLDIRRKANQGIYPLNSFPHTFTMDLKTDVLCTDQNVCVDEQQATQASAYSGVRR